MIFLLPPSMDELRRRITRRGEDAPEVIEKRLAEAKKEIQKADFYDYLVVNDDFDEAALQLRSIIRAHRIQKNRPTTLVDRLLGD